MKIIPQMNNKYTRYIIFYDLDKKIELFYYNIFDIIY